MRFAICSRGISSEKTATPTPCSSQRCDGSAAASRPLGLATFVATLSTKLVLPMPGRAATIVRSPGVQARGEAVVALEARRDARDAVAALHGVGERLEGLLHHVEQALDAARLRRAGDLVDGLLGVVDERLGLAVVQIPLRRDALTRRDELPHAV